MTADVEEAGTEVEGAEVSAGGVPTVVLLAALPPSAAAVVPGWDPCVLEEAAAVVGAGSAGVVSNADVGGAGWASSDREQAADSTSSIAVPESAKARRPRRGGFREVNMRASPA
ncbi:MAG: hypothetical protein OXS29_11420 [bacterium]|nr:hypothetical protein [bacterium]MDE0287902.1 hypothetical protein [bacterium]MDE0439719.1 hypothetical protein [bacterium]